MNIRVILLLVGFLAGPADAATIVAQLFNGYWVDQKTWSQADSGTVGASVFSNSAAIPAPQGGGDWSPEVPAVATGVFSGSLIFDDLTGEILGGHLIMTGTIAKISNDGSLLHLYTDVAWDFATELTTMASYSCHEGVVLTVSCSTGGAAPNALNIASGNEGTAGDARYGGDFSDWGSAYLSFYGTLNIFGEGYDGTDPTGIDYENNIYFAPVPIPAAAWLFGSALIGLGWFRRVKQ